MVQKTLILQSERLILRDFTENDWKAVFEYQSNPAYLKYYPSPPRAENHTKNLVDLFISWQNEVPRTKSQLAIILKNENKLVGNCGLRKIDSNATEAELGCELDPYYWSQGIASEAVRLMLQFGFEDLKLHRIWSTTKAENIAARNLIEKLHFQHEGTLREQEWLHDHWSDAVIYAILAKEWFQSRNSATSSVLSQIASS